MTTATAQNGTAATIGAVPVPRIEVPAPQIEEVTFRITGISPLICHRWSEKAKKEMLNKQMKKAAPAKAAKDPTADYLESLYPLEHGDGYGFPAIGFKAAMVRAGTYLDLKMTFLRGAFHVPGELVKIEGEPKMREDMVRLQGSTADIRYRGEFFPWAAELPIIFNARVISAEQLANLVLTAGFSVGVGEWRPERDGSYGMWEMG
jgi:hypothetical protein